MKPRRYHGLKRPKLRQSWNKYNLFNIAKYPLPKIGTSDNETFFQQKWRAKGLLRHYHGEHVVERKWTRMFSRRLLGVVDMDTKYMAEFDGSEMAAGRGSGKDEPPNWEHSKVMKRNLTPYMQMTFAPMERRLDIAVFRAMFASSTRQARQFCVHGAVKVNGKVMPYPAYRLNPGDMFQVEPERVLYATGEPKLDPNKKKNKRRRFGRSIREDSAEEPAEEEVEAAAEEASEEAAEQDPDTTDAPEPVPVDMKPTRKQVQEFAARCRKLLAEEEALGVKQKKKLRALMKDMKSLLSRTSRSSATPASISEELSSLVSGLTLTNEQAANNTIESTSQRSSRPDPIGDLSKDELKKLEKRMAEHEREEEENPHDPTKPYKTPWRPRPYMSPFAFIPKYLEVNHNICAAVYLRHPVAKLGKAEVPTPFPENINQLAFNWYLRRR